MRKRNILLISILFLVIGFAAVSTALFINGNSAIANKQEDFDVYFSDAYIDDWQVLEIISQDKKTITYETDRLINKNEKSVLDYEVTNASRQYDARVSIECVPSETDLVKIEASVESDIIEARSKSKGQVIITLKENTSEEKRIEFTCVLQVDAIERDSSVNTDISPTEVKYRTWEYSYENEGKEFIIPRSGVYQLEVWGAQGGSSLGGAVGGYGAYAVGQIVLTEGTPVYIYVGGEGNGNSSHVYQAGGFNGGGNATPDEDSHTRQASGGGATHISLRDALLKDLEEYKDDILIVAAAGGGAGNNSVTPNDGGQGGSGGGIKGNNSWPYMGASSSGGTQTTPGNSRDNFYVLASFGIGASCLYAGGGGGLYGGGCGASSSGAGGSSYIGNTLLTEKVMVCYNCKTSDEESTKTISVTDVSEDPIANYAKKGHGYAKITYLGK